MLDVLELCNLYKVVFIRHYEVIGIIPLLTAKFKALRAVLGTCSGLT